MPFSLTLERSAGGVRAPPTAALALRRAGTKPSAASQGEVLGAQPGNVTMQFKSGAQSALARSLKAARARAPLSVRWRTQGVVLRDAQPRQVPRFRPHEAGAGGPRAGQPVRVRLRTDVAG